jgi:DMSO reductase anchor subunit
VIALAAAFMLPLPLSLAGWLAPVSLAPLCVIASAVIATIGVLIERWLFFAEAKHTVTLYYGAEQA